MPEPKIRAQAVIFDMDGVLINSEPLWDAVLAELAAECGAAWTAETGALVAGMGSKDASAFMVERLGFPGPAAGLEAEYDRRILARYRRAVPEMPGAGRTLRRLSEAGFVLGLASSSNRLLLDQVVRSLGLESLLGVTVSEEDVPHGKPQPDIYLEACAGLGLAPEVCVAVEDSLYGIRSAAAAGLAVIALVRDGRPLDASVEKMACATVDRLDAIPALLVRAD